MAVKLHVITGAIHYFNTQHVCLCEYNNSRIPSCTETKKGHENRHISTLKQAINKVYDYCHT